MHGLKKLLQDCNAGRSQAAGTLKAKFAGELIEIALQDGNGIGKARESGIAAHLADGAQNADGAELFENVGVAKDGGLDGRRLVAGLVLPDGLEDCGDFVFGKAHLAQDDGSP
jgi:hypothetical protein